jgi:hypothetical protein
MTETHVEETIEREVETTETPDNGNANGGDAAETHEEK